MAGTAVSAKELKRRDLILHGDLWKVLISITFPLFFYTFINGFSNILDNFMCAKISATAVSSSVLVTQIINMISAVGSGISAGGSILIAREIGKNNYPQAKRLSSTVFSFVFLLGLIIMAVFIPLAKPILIFSGSTLQEADLAKNYFIVQIVTVCFQMINSVYMGVEKARGSTKGITFLNIGVMALKAGLSAIFIYVMQVDDMTWVGVATLVANASLTVFIIVRLLMRNYIFRFSLKDADFSFKTTKRVTLLSFPIFLGKFIFSLGKWLVLKMAADFYGEGTAKPQPLAKGALGISNNMGGLVTNSLSSVEDSESAIISTNLGAGQTDRALKTFKYAMILEILMSVIGVGVISIPQVNDGIVRLFATTSKHGYDADYANMISSIFFYEKMGIVTLAINSAVLGLLYGFGYTRLSMVINFARVFVFRIPSLLVLHFGLNMDYTALGVAMGFSNISIGVVAVVTVIFVIRNIKKKQKEKEEARMVTEETKAKTERLIKSYLNGFYHYKEDKAWDYEDGVVCLGAYDMYAATKDKFYLDFLVKHFDACIRADGTIDSYDPEEKNIDNVQKGTALYLLNLVHHEDKYDKALKLLDHQLDIQQRTASGSFWHKGRYPYQIWLDGLYMGLPYYALRATEEHSIKMKKDIVNQFMNVEKFNWDPQKKVYMHCYDETKSMQWADKTTGRSPNVWLRSVGWLAMAEADVYQIFNDRGGTVSALKLKPLLKKVLSSMEPYQDQTTHLYYDLPLLPEEKGNYLETSGSLMLAYGYLKGSRLGMIPSKEIQKGAEMLESVLTNYLKDDGLHNVCQVSGLDGQRRNGSVAYYLSEPVVISDPKGFGPLMMAYAEYLRATK